MQVNDRVEVDHPCPANHPSLTPRRKLGAAIPLSALAQRFPRSQKLAIVANLELYDTTPF